MASILLAGLAIALVAVVFAKIAPKSSITAKCVIPSNRASYVYNEVV